MKTIEEKLAPALTPHETRWAADLADKLPDDVDLTFEECKILTRIHIDDWPAELLLKVKDAIDFDDFMTASEDEAEYGDEPPQYLDEEITEEDDDEEDLP